MRGYPIGSFLFWKVTPENVKTFVFYGFLKGYDAYRLPEESSRDAYRIRHDPGGVPQTVAAFDDFHEARKERVAGRLRKMLGVLTTE
jgi:hypothetical protein